MTSTKKDPVLVVLRLSGGNDALNTIVPYNDPLYIDYRPVVRIDPSQVLPIDDKLGFNPNMASSRSFTTRGRWPSARAWESPAQPLSLPLHGHLAHR